MSASAKAALLLLALTLCHAALGLWALRAQSATYDEPMLVATGYAYWRTGDFQMDPGNLPLGKLLISAPLLLLSPALPSFTYSGSLIQYDYMFAERFFFWMRNDADRMLFLARCVNLALSCFLGLLLWRALRGRCGEAAALLGAALYYFSPSVLAYASVATVDFTAAFFVTAAMLLFWNFADEPGAGRALAVGAASCAAFFCKHSALLLWPAFAGALALGALKKEARLLALWGFLPWLAAFGLYAAFEPVALQGLVYRFHQVGQLAQPAYLFGRLSTTGWRLYYLVALLVKSSPAELAAAIGVALTFWRKPQELTAGIVAAFALFLLYFTAASLSRLEVGLRYVLPVYPMLALLAGAACEQWLKSGKAWKIFALALGLTQAACAAYAAPDFIPYFNVFAGGAAGGERILGDSNLDWGQDLKRLAAYLSAQGDPEVILSYFGTAAPEYYGIHAQRIYSHNAYQDPWTDSDKPSKELLVVSVTNLQGVYLPRQDIFAWVKALPLQARIGKTLYVYDVTRNAGAHRELAKIYGALAEPALTAHELRRADSIDNEAAQSAAAKAVKLP